MTQLASIRNLRPKLDQDILAALLQSLSEWFGNRSIEESKSSSLAVGLSYGSLAQ